MELDIKLSNFKSEIENGLKEIANNFSYIDEKVKKPEYAFLYWVLLNLYNIDEEFISSCITEYNDKSIDCFVHFEESKELFIIQCKYYEQNSAIDRKDVSDFLQMPMTALLRGDYKKSAELQKIFSDAIADPEYKIYFHFYATTTHYSRDIEDSVSRFNTQYSDYKTLLHAEYFDLKNIYEKYYGESYVEKKPLKFMLGTVNKGTFASLRDEYNISDLRCETYYIITPVSEIYRLRNVAKTSGYQLFEENIREYLGESSVNKGIIDTLKGDEKGNFLFYNNGITMICSNVGHQETKNGMRYLEVMNPQVVNGCQTVNSIYTVLSSLSEKDISQLYKNVFVMVKILVISENADDDRAFYRNVVKYTNRQNAVPEKVFASNEHSVFVRLQKEFEKRGFYLRVKQSDKAKFDREYSPKQKADLVVKAKKFIFGLGLDIKGTNDICIDLEKLLQVLITYIKDGHFGFTKKATVLKQNSEVFRTISVNIQDYISIDNMIKLYYLYRRAEREQKASNDKRTPVPYYMIGFISYHIKSEKNNQTMNLQLNNLFSLDETTFNKVYEYLVRLSNLYVLGCKKNGIEYNVMIKQKINYNAVDYAIELYQSMNSSEFFDILKT